MRRTSRDAKSQFFLRCETVCEQGATGCNIGLREEPYPDSDDKEVRNMATAYSSTAAGCLENGRIKDLGTVKMRSHPPTAALSESSPTWTPKGAKAETRRRGQSENYAFTGLSDTFQRFSSK
jgi:hypothetical protein